MALAGSLLLGGLATVSVAAASAGATVTVTASTTVVIPANNANVSGTSVVLDAAATSGASSVVYQVSGEGLTNQVIATATPTIWGWLAIWNSTSVPNGTYTLQSVASYSGVGSVSSLAITVNINNAAPSTTVVYPGADTIVNNNVPNFFDAAASPGVTSVQFTISGHGIVPWVFSATPTIYGWIGIFPAMPSGGLVPVTLQFSVQSVATYAGGVSGASPPVTIFVTVYVQPVAP